MGLKRVDGVALRDLEFTIIPAKTPPAGLIPRYESTYAEWKKVWEQTFRELDGVDAFHSDDFLRQDEVCTLTYCGDPVAISLFSRKDLRLQAHRDCSYFRPFPAQVLARVRTLMPEILVGSYFSIHPKWRSGCGGLSVKEIFFALLTRRFIETGARHMLGIMRRDRGMHELSQYYGARVLAHDLVYHGVGVDLVAFDSETVERRPLGERIDFTVHHLWASRVDGNIPLPASPLIHSQ
jgi:hypothetical protein